MLALEPDPEGEAAEGDEDRDGQVGVALRGRVGRAAGDGDGDQRGQPDDDPAPGAQQPRGGPQRRGEQAPLLDVEVADRLLAQAVVDRGLEGRLQQRVVDVERGEDRLVGEDARVQALGVVERGGAQEPHVGGVPQRRQVLERRAGEEQVEHEHGGQADDEHALGRGAERQRAPRRLDAAAAAQGQVAEAAGQQQRHHDQREQREGQPDDHEQDQHQRDQGDAGQVGGAERPQQSARVVAQRADRGQQRAAGGHEERVDEQPAQDGADAHALTFPTDCPGAKVRYVPGWTCSFSHVGTAPMKTRYWALSKSTCSCGMST